MSQVTSNTSTEEIQEIYNYYVSDDGTSVDYDAIATAIETGDDSHGSIDDMITAYLQGQGQLPDFMMSPEAYLGNPEDYPWLWETDVVSSMQQLGDLYGNNDGVLNEGDLASIRNFLTWGGAVDAETGELESDLISQIEASLEEMGVDEENADDAASDIYNLFSTNDLSEVMTLFMSMGNPGVALLLYVAYGLAPESQDLQEAAVDVIGDSNEQMEELMDDLKDIDPEDITAQYDSQAISQQLSVISSVLSTMSQFIQDAQDMIDKMLEMASNLSQQSNQTVASTIRNI